MQPKRVSLLGLPVSLSATKASTVSSMMQILRSPTPGLVTFVNPHAFYLSSINQGYLNSLWHFDLVLPDGIGVVKAMRWLHRENVERQSFDATSLFNPVFSLLNDGKFSLCLIGAKPSIASLAQKRMMSKYPQIHYKGCLDGYRSFDELVAWTMERKPDVVLVAMGAPHQEAFLLRLKQSGFSGLGITCGGFFDQFSESVSYYPPIVDKLEMRWIYRLLREPKRLARRYLIEYRGFVLNVLYRRAVRRVFNQSDMPMIWK
jgi:N-acetylglucosaminyldiphosphoundecaprenol N-acetyl-beta-D-mannosaminyltransferase